MGKMASVLRRYHVGIASVSGAVWGGLTQRAVGFVKRGLMVFSAVLISWINVRWQPKADIAEALELAHTRAYRPK
jgi:hypothetical protein